MRNIISDVRDEIIKLENMMEKIDGFLNYAPEGSLKCQRRREKIYYYQQYMDIAHKDSSVGKWKRKYITNENIALAKNLAKKHYYSTLKSVITKRIKALKIFEKNYPTKEIESIYDDLCDERKKLVEPIEITVKEKVRKWKEEEYEKNMMYPENLRYRTEQKELVRSKSEVIIANLLYQHRKDILYKYEKPLEIVENGHKKIIYPDFTIINIHTGKVTYWEHVGRTDDPVYANEFVRKLNVYADNDLIVGRDVVLSFETSTVSLDISAVKQLIKAIQHEN